jgi:hypothetical protein
VFYAGQEKTLWEAKKEKENKLLMWFTFLRSQQTLICLQEDIAGYSERYWATQEFTGVGINPERVLGLGEEAADITGVWLP